MRGGKSKGRFRDFCKGFFATLAVLVPLYACVFFIQFNKMDAPAAESAADPFDKVPVATAKSYNLLLLVKDGVTGRLLTASLVRFDVPDGRLIVCDIPATAILLEEKQPKTISEVFASKGSLGAAAAVRSTLGVPLSGYAAMDTDTLAALVDRLGEFSFTLAQPLEVRNEDWLVTYSKQAGTSWFTGNDVAKLLAYGNYEGEQAAALRKGLFEAALTAYARADFPDALSEAYARLVNDFDTDVGTAGFYNLTLAARAVCGDAGAGFTVRTADGAFDGGRFEFSHAAAQELQRLFGN